MCVFFFFLARIIQKTIRVPASREYEFVTRRKSALSTSHPSFGPPSNRFKSVAFTRLYFLYTYKKSNDNRPSRRRNKYTNRRIPRGQRKTAMRVVVVVVATFDWHAVICRVGRTEFLISLSRFPVFRHRRRQIRKFGPFNCTGIKFFNDAKTLDPHCNDRRPPPEYAFRRTVKPHRAAYNCYGSRLS